MYVLTVFYKRDYTVYSVIRTTTIIHGILLGKTVRKALEDFKKTHNPCPGSDSQWAAGNGSLMRLCPLPLAYALNPELAMELSSRHSKATHGAQVARDACRYFAG